MQPITVRQKLMHYLADDSIGFAPSKEQLAKAINSTPNTVAIELTRLGKAGYVAENKGMYTITPVGKAAYELDPMLSQLKNGKHEENSQSPFYIDWDYVNNDYVSWGVFEATFKEGFDFRKLLPIVLLYLQSINYPLPVQPDKPEATNVAKKEVELLIDYMTKLSSLE